MKFAVCVIFLCAAFAVTAGAQTVSVKIGKLTRGKVAYGTVFLNIPDGYHVNSNRPYDDNLLPTKVEVAAAGLRLLAVEYPKGADQTFAFSDRPLNVYEGRVKIRFRLLVPRGLRKSSVLLRISTSFQPCTDEVCYQPRTKVIRIRSRIR